MERLKALPEHWLSFIRGAEDVQLIHRRPPFLKRLGLGRKELETGTNLSVLDYHLQKLEGDPVHTITLTGTDRERVLGAIQQGVHEGKDVARCFFPHHFLEARSGERLLTLSICFKCLAIWGEFGVEKASFATSRFANPMFDSYFSQS